MADASVAQSIPLTTNDNGTNFDIVSRPAPKGQQRRRGYVSLAFNYFATLNLPKLERARFYGAGRRTGSACGDR
ncbi:MAG: hypothetical protein U0Y68_05410 [Blastocatellia bacterium]